MRTCRKPPPISGLEGFPAQRSPGRNADLLCPQDTDDSSLLPAALLLRAERWQLAALMIGVGAGHGVGGGMATEMSSVQGLAAAPCPALSIPRAEGLQFLYGRGGWANRSLPGLGWLGKCVIFTKVKVRLFDLRRRTCPEAMVPWGRLAPRVTDQLPGAVAKQRTSGDPWSPGKGEDRAREI